MENVYKQNIYGEVGVKKLIRKHIKIVGPIMLIICIALVILTFNIVEEKIVISSFLKDFYNEYFVFNWIMIISVFTLIFCSIFNKLLFRDKKKTLKFFILCILRVFSIILMIWLILVVIAYKSSFGVVVIGSTPIVIIYWILHTILKLGQINK